MNISENLKNEQYVAYIDVLGFKEIVKNKGEKLDVYFETISNAINDINVEKPLIKSQLVSDSIILACEISNENLKLLFQAIQTIQSRCAIQNIWLRGAVSLGDIYFNPENNIVVGNGLIEAYLLETQEKYPRVIIDPRIIKKSFNSQKNQFYNFFNKPQKTPLIFDISNHFVTIDNSTIFVSFCERIIEENIENLLVIYKYIQEELYNSHQNYSKYLWLKNYFTESIMHAINIGLFEKENLLDNHTFHEKLLFHWGNFESL